MNKKDKQQAREELREWAVKWSGDCAIQEGRDKKAWPCGTCFCHLLGQLVDGADEAYSDRDLKDVDRINEVWRFILQLRDEKY